MESRTDGVLACEHRYFVVRYAWLAEFVQNELAEGEASIVAVADASIFGVALHVGQERAGYIPLVHPMRAGAGLAGKRFIF